MKITVISLISILIIISNLYSQGIPYGQEFQVNTDTQTTKACPSVTGLSDSGFVICWLSYAQNGLNSGIFGQIFKSSGNKSGNEFQISTCAHASWPAVMSLQTGDFVVCWEGYEDLPSLTQYDIYGQMFYSSGTNNGSEFLVNTYTNYCQGNASIAGLPDGGFVVCWMDGSPLHNGIYGQMYDAFGNKKGAEFQVNSYTNGSQKNPAIANLKDGGYLVCWDSKVQAGNGCDIFCQIFNSSGTKRGVEFQVNTFAVYDQSNPQVAGLEDGGFVVVWQFHETERPYRENISGQIFEASGTKRGSEFWINSFTNDNKYYPYIAALSNGSFVICWQTYHRFSSTHISHYSCGQLFNASAAKIGNEFKVSTYNVFSPLYPSIAGLKNGKFIACWEDWEIRDGYCYYEIIAKIFINEPIDHPLHDYSLLEPVNDTTLNSNCPTFRWQQPSTIRECYPWEITFDLYIDTDSNFPYPQIIKNIEDTTYTIDSLAAGKTYFWKVLAKNLAGDSLWSTQQDWGFFIKHGATFVVDSNNELPQSFELLQNYPNPFNSSTEIRYSLPSGKASYPVQLKIYDVLGRLVKALVDQEQSAGSYTISWDGTDLSGNHVSSGVYFYSLHAGDLKSIRKMLVLQ